MTRRGARTREQLERLERYGAHLANQNDRIIERLERLERYGAHLSQQNDVLATTLEQLGRGDHPTSTPGRPIGLFPVELAAELRDAVGIRRAVETGTAGGYGTRLMAGVFDEVVSIELSEGLHEIARQELADLPHVRLLLGDSGSLLGEALSPSEPTLYWLDGHWVGGTTAGADRQCPILEEIRQLEPGHRDDCILIDDARCFTAAPLPPFAPDQWPTVIEVLDALRAIRPDSHITVVQDLIVSVPAVAKPAIDGFAWDPLAPESVAPASNGQVGQPSASSK